MAPALSEFYDEVIAIDGPGFVEGGDILVTEREILVGRIAPTLQGSARYENWSPVGAISFARSRPRPACCISKPIVLCWTRIQFWPQNGWCGRVVSTGTGSCKSLRAKRRPPMPSGSMIMSFYPQAFPKQPAFSKDMDIQ